jgi:hypothetical protein
MKGAAMLAAAATLGSLTACSADLGGGAGIEARTGHALGFGRIAASTKIGPSGAPLNQRGVLVGTSLEARAEQSRGSRWDLGLMMGWGFGPAEVDGKLGFEAFGEVGTPVRATLVENGDFYLGAGTALTIPLNTARDAADLNRSTWILKRRFELMPELQSRFHFDHPNGGDLIVRTDVEAGISFRLRVFSDLF